MVKNLVVFFGGFICACILFIFLFLPMEDRAQFNYGYTNGLVGGRLEGVDEIQKEFGTYDGHSSYKVLFSVHTSDVIAIETNGIKTVRVIP